MNWEALGATGEIVGAGAVVVSLVYLAVQIREQNREARFAAMHEIAVGFREVTGIGTDMAWADVATRGLKDFASLDEPEKLSMFSAFTNIFRVCEEAFLLHRAGRLDPSYWRGMESYLATIIDSEAVNYIWSVRKHFFDEEFQRFIENLEAREWVRS